MLLCLNDDPQFDLALPADVLTRVVGGTSLQVELTAQPLLDALRVVLREMREPPRPAPALPATMRSQLPASAAGHLADLGELLKTVVERKNATIAAQVGEIQVMRDRQNLLNEQLVRAEAQLDLLKQLVLPEAASRLERL
jgi:hypothetical protein